MANPKCTKRADGRYQRKIYLGMDENGKKKYKYIYGYTAKEVNRQAEEVLYSLHKGTDILSGDLAFSRWADRYLLLKEGKVAEVYFAGLKSRIAFWNQEIGDIPLSKITRSQMQIALDALAAHNPNKQGRPTSVKTLRDYRLAASGVFELAMIDRAATYNPAQYLEIRGGEPKNTRRALTDEEQQWVLNTKHRAQTAAMIMMLAGLRRGELLALRAGDIDLKQGTLTVDKAVKFVGGHPEIKRGGKTDAATRTIQIPDKLINYLRPILSELSPFDLLVPGKNGAPMTETAWKRMWSSYIAELNFKYGNFIQDVKSKYDPRITMVINPFTAHCLRHTYASNLVMAGVDPITAKQQLGHTDIHTTLNIYVHINESHTAAQMNKVNEYLAKRYG